MTNDELDILIDKEDWCAIIKYGRDICSIIANTEKSDYAERFPDLRVMAFAGVQVATSIKADENSLYAFLLGELQAAYLLGKQTAEPVPEAFK